MSYFGKRYLDAEVGRWTGVDPKREFWTSYRYTTNPIGFIDPNGLAELRYALYQVESSGKAQQFQDYYGQFVSDGDNLVVKEFTPDQKADMMAFLKEGDKSAIGAHSYNGAEGICYKIFDNLLKFADLNYEMSLAKKNVYVDACFAEENLPQGQDVYGNTKAAAGTSGIIYVGPAGMKSLGVETPAKTIGKK